ncbi:MAG: hypothetical protein H7Y38_04445, partial [Armatimonadetes bacterium]|nr:hypothetical protein [Armatimonadota bacterium]
YSTTPVMTLYMTSDAARAAGVPPERIAYRVVRALRRSGADAEANQISVIGQNPQTGAYITASYDDADSQNPALLPAERPENWRGQLVGYGLTDPQITTQGTANRARDIATERLTTGKAFFEIVADFLIRADAGFEGLPVWKGDVLQGFEPGAGVASMNVKVLSLSMNSVFEGAAAGKVNHRSATYQCEQVSEVLA